ncbi:MAG TPA: PIN domain-containing protein [Thermoanaerobaculia bacterium]|nr:PIN domain-containing protein [Thermoanaerobaculia bacterium]
MIHLDTHVVVWLYAGRVDLFPSRVRGVMEEDELAISPIVLLELQYLNEIRRIDADAATIVVSLERTIGLHTATAPFEDVVREACGSSWTRDPFDRLIVAQAGLEAARLLTKDASIRRHYKAAVWAGRR